MKTFVIGDIHGAYKALLQCFEKSRFDYKNDRLIVLGDVCDGYPQVKECIDELLKVKKLNYIIGNHDVWALQWAQEGWKDRIWLEQGGYNTIASYGDDEMPKKHIRFLEQAYPWILDNGRIFVHAGFEPNMSLEVQGLDILTWDRNLFFGAKNGHDMDPNYKIGGFEEIFIGHTTTEVFNSLVPLHFCNVWALDTGGGMSGKLTIMNVETKKYWQSDLTGNLYKNKIK